MWLRLVEESGKLGVKKDEDEEMAGEEEGIGKWKGIVMRRKG